MLFNTDSTAEFLSRPILKKFNEYSDAYFNESKCSTAYLAARVYDFLDLIEKVQKILPAIDELNMNYFSNEKLSFYSDMCGMSESNFRKLFKEYTVNHLLNVGTLYA